MFSTSYQFVTIPKMPSICIPPWAGGTVTIKVGACDPRGRPPGLAPRSTRSQNGINTQLSKNTNTVTAKPRPVALSSEGRSRCWPSPGLCGGQRRCHRKFLGLRMVALPLRGYRGPGQSVRTLSPPVLGPRGGRGHTCRTPPRACSVSNATSQSAECQAGTQSACQQRLRYMRGWSFLHIGGRRAATTPRVQCCELGLGRWPRGHVKVKGAVPDAAGITPSCACNEEGRQGCRREASAQRGDENISTCSEPDTITTRNNCPWEYQCLLSTASRVVVSVAQPGKSPTLSLN